MYLDFHGEPPPVTVRGVAMTDNSDVYAVCCTAIIHGENFIIFGSKPGFSKRDILIGWKVFEKTLDDKKTYYALIDESLDTAPGFLKHFNFRHLNSDIYIYEG